MKLRFIALSLLVMTGTAFANTSNWVNQRQSTLQLNFDGNGHLTGTFVNRAAGSSPCALNKPQPVVGTYDGELVSFVVDFPACHSSSTWNGHITNGGNVIDTMWILTLDDDSVPAWTTNYIGHDAFTKTG